MLAELIASSDAVDAFLILAGFALLIAASSWNGGRK